MLELSTSLIHLAWTPGPLELGIILVVALLLFGGRLPTMMRNRGRGVTGFKRRIKDASQELKQTIDKGAEENDQNHDEEPRS